MRVKVALIASLFNLLLFGQVCWAGQIQVFVNSQYLELSAAPVSEQDHTMVPLREIFQALEAEVQWDDYTQTVSARRGNKQIKIQIGRGTAVRDGEVINLEVPAKLINNLTYVPLRFVGEALGATVKWSEVEQRVYIECQAITEPVADQPLTVKEIARRSNAIVLLKVYGADGEIIATGSGFVVRSDGQIITNYHVIQGAGSVEVITQDNKVFVAQGVTAYSEEQDLAVLQLSQAKDLPIVFLGDSTNLELGEDVVAIGSPLALQNTVSTGIVSGFRDWEGLNYIQITVPLSPGSSGGALFNMYGQVVGVTAAGFEAGQNLNLAIPINQVKGLLKASDSVPFNELDNS